jgi:hypothetical protein
VTRLVALLRSRTPLGGICPACDAQMDDSGCRLGDHFISKDASLTKGIAQIIEVFCEGTPTAPLVDCPACSP